MKIKKTKQTLLPNVCASHPQKKVIFKAPKGKHLSYNILLFIDFV